MHKLGSLPSSFRENIFLQLILPIKKCKPITQFLQKNYRKSLINKELIKQFKQLNSSGIILNIEKKINANPFNITSKSMVSMATTSYENNSFLYLTYLSS